MVWKCYATFWAGLSTSVLSSVQGNQPQQPLPLVWDATAEPILTKVARGRVALNKETKSRTHR